ncbi:MAG: hypothetical protein JXN59_09645 [Anaerolineae bacterium]|nr:hypothetical protein [Anaerolineae bacterium]
MAGFGRIVVRCVNIMLLLGLVLLPGMPRPAQAQDAVAWQVLTLVNQARAAAGAGPLSMNGALVAAAQRHSSDMAANNFLGHTGSDGSTAAQRISQAGYNWERVGENAAQTWGVDAGQVVSLWMGSAGHRANLLNPAFIDMGLAYATASNGAVYYTQTLGTQPGAVPPPVEAPPPTAVPPTQVPPTAVPPTQVPPTAVPPTRVPPTAIPPTQVPPTRIPPTAVPPTQVPPTVVQPTQVPPTQVPPTAIPALIITTQAPPEGGLPTPTLPASALPSSTPLPSGTPLPSATPPPTWTPASFPQATKIPPVVTVIPASGQISPGVVQLVEEPGIPWTLWFQRLPVGYRPVNAQGIELLPEDGIPPELWFQLPPALPQGE